MKMVVVGRTTQGLGCRAKREGTCCSKNLVASTPYSCTLSRAGAPSSLCNRSRHCLVQGNRTVHLIEAKLCTPGAEVEGSEGLHGNSDRGTHTQHLSRAAT